MTNDREFRIPLWVDLLIVMVLVAIGVAWYAEANAAPTAAAPAKAPAAQVQRSQRTTEIQYVLRSYGYTIVVDGLYGPQTTRVVKAWQKANGLIVDGLVGTETLDSLGLAATATVPAKRLNPPAPVAPAPVGDVESIIRDVWPDNLEDRAVQIAWRESRHQPEVINANGDATGLFQVMWSVHDVWLCPQLGVCAQSQLQDARTNSEAALALYERAGGWGPWAL